MNPNKSMLTVEITNDLGNDLEDRLESEVKTANELAGAAAALDQAAIKVHSGLVAKAKDDANIKDGLTREEVLKLVINYVTRAGDYLKAMSSAEQQKAITQGGRVEGMQAVVAVLKKKREAETKKLQMMIALAKEQEQAEEKGEEVPRTAAEMARAEHGSAADRRAEAKSEKVTKKIIKKTPKKTTKKKTKKKTAKKAAG